MTRLDRRLTRLEQRVEEIHHMLRLLLGARHLAADDAPDGEQGAGLPDAPPAESLLPAVPAVPDEVALSTLVDPLEIQYAIALNWAAEGRRQGPPESLAEFDLAGRNLRGVDLKDAELRGADLSRADLTGARLVRADLSGADLSRARIARADLSRVTLVEADLTFAHMAYAKLDSANLRYAVLTRANLSGANLSNADLGAALLHRANLTRANLRGAQVHRRQLAAASTLDGATMPDGRLFDGDPEPWRPESRG